MTLPRLLPCLLWGLFGGLLFPLADADTAAVAKGHGKDPFTLDVQRFQLANGMTVLLHRDATLPQVVVSLWFDVGSKNEALGRTGFAHLYEHLMFMGTKNVPGGGFDQVMEAEGGQNNATTSADRTFYFDSGPTHLLPTLLWLEAERLTTLPEVMSDEKVALQREVVRNERRQSYENRPYGKAELLISEAMYPKGHPYSWPVIGSHADLLAASTEDVKGFFYKYYAPSNATLAVVGDINPTEARRLIEHYFGWMQKTPRPAALKVEAPQAPVQKRLTVEDQVELPRIYLLWHSPAAGTEGSVETQLLADVLGKGKSSRLHHALVFEKQIAQSVEVEMEPQVLGSMLTVQVTARKGVLPAALLSATEAELAKVVTTAVSEAELARAKNQQLTEWAQSIETVLGRSEMMQAGQALYGDPNALTKQVEQLRRMTPQQIMARAAALHLSDPERRLTLSVVPAQKTAGAAGNDKGAAAQKKPAAPASVAQAAVKPPIDNRGASPSAIDNRGASPSAIDNRGASPSAIDLSKRPTLGPLQAFKAPKNARFRVGDLDVLLVRRPGAALLAAQVVVPGGNRGLSPDQAGLPAAVAAMLTEGAGARGATQVADDLERLGAIVRAHATADAITVSLDVMAEKYGEAAPILYDVVAAPRFEAAEWKRVQAERITEVVRARAEPGFAAERGLASALFGEQHPYGMGTRGVETTLSRLGVADLRTYHQARFQPKSAVLVIAGDVELSQAQAEKLAAPFSAWKASGPAALVLAASPAPRPEKRRLVLIDRPGAPQSELRMATISQARKNPDRAVADVANTLLGGAFTSRLNQNLREQHGWAYGAGSRFQRLLDTGYFVAQAAVRTDATADSVGEMIKELRRMGAEPVNQAELIKGRKSSVQRLVSLCERVAGLAQAFGEIALYGLPADELSQLSRDSQHATAAMVQKVAQRYFVPEKATLVVVGDRKTVEPALRKLDLSGAEVEYRDVNGALLPVAKSTPK